jgi:hypothetical protein
MPEGQYGNGVEHQPVIAVTTDRLISEIGDFTGNALMTLCVSMETPLEPSSNKNAARSPHIRR